MRQAQEINHHVHAHRLQLLKDAFHRFLKGINCSVAKINRDFNSSGEYFRSNDCYENEQQMSSSSVFLTRGGIATGKKDTFHVIFKTRFNNRLRYKIFNWIHEMESILMKLSKGSADQTANFQDLYRKIMSLRTEETTVKLPGCFSDSMMKLVNDTRLIVGIHFKDTDGPLVLKQRLEDYIRKRRYGLRSFIFRTYSHQLTMNNIKIASSLVDFIDTHLKNPGSHSHHFFFNSLALRCQAYLTSIKSCCHEYHVNPGILHDLLKIFENERVAHNKDQACTSDFTTHSDCIATIVEVHATVVPARSTSASF